MQIIIKGIIVFVLFLAFKVNGQANYDFSEKLTSYLFIQNKRLNFNGTVIVANKDNILYQKAIGFSSHELQVPLSIDSKFKIASISKSFTGILVAMAIKEGTLKLSDTIKQYFADYSLKDGWNQITIQHLVSHTSGIPHWKGYKDYWTIKSKLPLNTKQVLSDIFEMDLGFTPGEKVNYSSPAYYLLATILEKVYSDAYSNILEGKVFKPLKLDNTGECNDLSIIPKMASGYHLLANDSLVMSPHRSISTLKGAGSLYSNATDLLKWNRSLMSDTVWNAELKQNLFTLVTNHLMPHNNHAQYGMGFYIHKQKDGRPKTYQVAGGTFGYSCISVIYPQEKLTLIILGNVSFLPVNNIWSDIEKIILEKPFEFPRVIDKKILSEEDLKKFIGIYEASNNMKLEVLTYQGKLFAKLGNKPPFQIYAESNSVFYGKKVGIKFIFNVLTDNKTVSGLKAEGRGNVFEFKKE